VAAGKSITRKQNSGSEEDALQRRSEPSDPISSGIEEIALRLVSADGSNATLPALIDEVTSQSGYSRDRVVRRLMDLSQRGRIVLVERRPYSSFASYVLSPNSLWFWGAFIATLLSLGLIFVTSGVGLYLRYAFGGLLILFLPGYSLIELLYAKKKELDQLTRIALSFGLSLALVSLTGLVLNYTPFGIRLLPVTISITGFTAVLLILAAKRKHTYYKLARDIV
jgi:hypothetical protein